MNCFQCCMSEEKVKRKSSKKSVKEHQEPKALSSFANISFKSGWLSSHWLHITVFSISSLNLHVGFISSLEFETRFRVSTVLAQNQCFSIES